MVAARISITLEPREVHSLEATKYRFLYSDKYIPFIPEYKEMIQGMLYLTNYTISHNKNSLRSFINAIAHRRYSPTLSEKDLGEAKSEDEGDVPIFEVGNETYRLDEMSVRDAKSKSYVFTAEIEDLQFIESIKEKLHSYAKLNISDVKDSEILKEVISFVLNHNFRNHQFVFYTYIGALFNLKPVTPLKVFLNRELAGDLMVYFPKMNLNSEEIDTLKKVALDIDQFSKFRKKIKSLTFPKDYKSLYENAAGLYSDVSDFNYWNAALGFWLMASNLPFNTTVFSLQAIASLISQLKPSKMDKENDIWDARRDFFKDLVDDLITLGLGLLSKKE